MNTAIATAVSVLLKSAGRQPVHAGGELDGATVVVGNYSECFDALWDIDRWVQWSRSQRGALILVCDAPPASAGEDPYIEPHITAFDWIVAFAVAAKKASVQPCRVIAIDVFSDIFATAPCVQLFETVRLSTILPHVTVINHDSVAELPAALDDVSEPAAGNPEILSRLLSGLLVAPVNTESRHSLSNLVGARVLLRSMAGEAIAQPASGSMRALERVFEALELLPSVGPSKYTAPWIEGGAWRDRIQKFVLLDDMADCGWSDFIRIAMNLDPDQLIVFRDPVLALEQLGDLIKASRIGIFLDLRLFSARPFEEEQAFLKSMVESIATMDVKASLSWPRIAHSELNLVRNAIESGQRDTEGYFAALTLLPRLLALRYPHTPIIVFSSTGRREIVERLTAYGNIVFDFDKPRFFGTASTAVVEETRLRFRKAIIRAVPLARADQVCRSLREWADQAAKRPVEHAVGVAELYLDESALKDSNRFAVGGFAIFYPDEETVNVLAQAMAREGLVWGLSQLDAVQPVVPRHLKKYAHNPEQTLPKIDALIREHGCDIMALCLFDNKRKDDSASINLLSDTAMDNRYHMMASDLIEAFLFGILGCCKTLPSKIRVDVATRVGTLSPAAKAVVPRAFSLPMRKGCDDEYYSLSPEDVYPMVAQLLTQYSANDLAGRIDRARGATLTDYDNRRLMYAAEGSPEYRPAAIHYLADWIARFGAVTHQPLHTARKWFEAGFLQKRNHAFLSWLDANRQAKRDVRSKAIQAASAAMNASGPLEIGGWLAHQAPEWLDLLNGDDFLELTRRLHRG